MGPWAMGQNSLPPSAVARVKAAVVTLVPMVACLTVGMFGVANSTCGDSSRVDCDRRGVVGKMSFQARRTRNTWIMKKSAVIHQKAHMPPQWHGAWWAAVGVALPRPRHGGAVPERAGGPQADRWRPLSSEGSLNWTLRRYVPDSSLRVWLMRRVSGIGGATAPGGRGGPSRAPRWPAGAAGCIRPVLIRERPNGVSRTSGRAPGYRASKNRQMEHLVQAMVSLRGGVRRDSAITPRERADPEDLVLTTLSNKAYV